MSTHYRDVEDYWDRRPCNSRHSPLQVGTHNYFEEVRKRRYFVEPHIRPFANFPAWYGKNVLDLGCGIGTDTIEFATNGARVTAVDISKKSLELTSRRAYAYSVEHRVTTVCANMENIPDFDQELSLIWAWGSIHHTANPPAVLKSIRSLCSPLTTVRLMVYNSLSTKALGLRLLHGREARRFSEAQENCPFTYWYTPGEAVTMVESAGFKVTSVSIDFIFPYDVAAYRLYKYSRRFPWNFITGQPFRWIEKHFGFHILIEAKPCP